jgi:hypothetical protein
MNNASEVFFIMIACIQANYYIIDAVGVEPTSSLHRFVYIRLKMHISLEGIRA